MESYTHILVHNEEPSNETLAQVKYLRTFNSLAFSRTASASRKRRFFAQFSQGEMLGAGSFGKVYAGIRLRDQLPVCTLHLSWKYMQTHGALLSAILLGIVQRVSSSAIVGTKLIKVQ